MQQPGGLSDVRVSRGGIKTIRQELFQTQGESPLIVDCEARLMHACCRFNPCSHRKAELAADSVLAATGKRKLLSCHQIVLFAERIAKQEWRRMKFLWQR